MSLRFILDENVSPSLAEFIKCRHPDWTVWHVRDVKLNGVPDHLLFAWAQENSAIVITFDEDFADAECCRLAGMLA